MAVSPGDHASVYFNSDTLKEPQMPLPETDVSPPPPFGTAGSRGPWGPLPASLLLAIPPSSVGFELVVPRFFLPLGCLDSPLWPLTVEGSQFFEGVAGWLSIRTMKQLIAHSLAGSRM